jgi:hypothetical protein
MTLTIWQQELLFFALAGVCLVWARARLPAEIAAFPGPRRVGRVFKVWLVVIWVVGALLPLAALGQDGFVSGHDVVYAALMPYLAMFFAQIATELICWKRLASPIWVLVPCLYLPWRLWQSVRGLDAVQADPAVAQLGLTVFTMYALVVLWTINIGVHYTNIPRSLRWDYHPRDRSLE